jgi:L-asparaginase
MLVIFCAYGLWCKNLRPAFFQYNRPISGSRRFPIQFKGIPMTLRVVATGGTFDKHYDELTGTLGFGTSHLTDVIKRARITVPIALQELALLDSLDMKDADRQRVLEVCSQASEAGIVIIHGTDTMRETAAVLGVAKLAKTIVLTGAMIPYEIANSDALFNFGFACGVAQTLPAGVYVAMNGHVFTWDNVTKNRAAGVFQEKS